MPPMEIDIHLCIDTLAKRNYLFLIFQRMVYLYGRRYRYFGMYSQVLAHDHN